jgi:GDP-L-fucose synthase
MVGSAIVRHLLAHGVYPNQIITRTHAELDLTNQAAVQTFFAQEKPDQVYMAAAKVGGIHANNTYPAEFIYDNLMMQANVIDAAFKNGVKKLLFLGSSCIYPKLASQPIREDALLTGTLEATNEPYAVAKIAGIKLCESYNRQFGNSHGVDFRSVMPTNLYGPGDNYHPENSHVIPALIRRFHEAKVAQAPSVAIWGTGTPKREFLYVDDMAAASVHVMNLPQATYSQHTSSMLSHINVGYGQDVTIAEAAQIIAQVVGYTGAVTFDATKPDGTPRKWMDSTRINALGWEAKVDLRHGLALAYQDYLNKHH